MSSLKKNYIYNVAYQTMLIIIPLVTAPYISRVLGVTGIGTFGYSFTIANYFLIFAKLGVDNYGNRSISVVRDDKEKLSRTFWSIYLLQFFLSSIILIFYTVYLIILGGDNNYIAIIQIIIVLSVFLDINWLFFGLELFKIITIRNISIKILTVISIFIFVRDSNDLWKYTIIMASGTFASQLTMWPYLKKYVYWIKPTINEIIIHFKSSIILFIPVIAVTLYKWMDKIMLGNMTNMTEVGYFESAEKLINIPMGFITALGTVMLPRMSNLIGRGELERSKIITEKSMLFTIFLSCGMAFGLLGISKSFVPLFFGEGYLPVIQLIYYLAPSMIFVSWANVIRTQYLIPNLKDTKYIISVFGGALVNIAVNFVLIPLYGAVGAAIGTLLAEVIVCCIQTVVTWKNMNFIKYIKQGFPFIIFGVSMYLIIYNIYLENSLATILVQIIVGAIFYILLSSLYMLLFLKNNSILSLINKFIRMKNR